MNHADLDRKQLHDQGDHGVPTDETSHKYYGIPLQESHVQDSYRYSQSYDHCDPDHYCGHDRDHHDAYRDHYYDYNRDPDHCDDHYDHSYPYNHPHYDHHHGHQTYQYHPSYAYYYEVIV